MAMDMVGANLDQMQAMGQRFEAEAVEVEALITRLTSVVEETRWEGKYARDFEARWNTEFKGALKNLAGALREAKTVVDTNRSNRQR
ncbi:MAG: WXG100 family type VII secretion target [Acidimicrobiia bacterium]|nr:WXG100 family type VII secretion target [Acidimicrobiia bacterium]